MMVGIILPIFTVYVMNIVKLLPLTAATVSPALVEPIPVVITDRGDSLLAYFKICDLPVPTICYVCVSMSSNTSKSKYSPTMLIVLW